MCDSFVALSAATADGSVLFAKSSDREPNEAHEVLLVPAAQYPQGAVVQCTYIAIPQAAGTASVLLTKPFNIWGAEMGVNEYGVVIGNEAVFTRVGQEGPRLTGMDLLRLGLERSDSAQSALTTIIALLEEYGQGGNCGYSHPMYYHNSFLICDPKSAWILETAGRQWVYREVERFGSISNALTIGTDWTDRSADLIKYAVEKKWCRGEADFSFSKCYSDLVFTTFSAGISRQKCTAAELSAREGKIQLADMIALLRHHTHQGSQWAPDRALIGADVCMHAGFGPVRIDQTVGSLVVSLKDGQITAWVTGTSAPCLSVFKPVWFDSGIPDCGPGPKADFEIDSMWWRHELLHRAILQDYAGLAPLYKSLQSDLELEFIAESEKAASKSASDRRILSDLCFQRVEEMERGLLQKISGEQHTPSARFYYQNAWHQFNRLAGLPDFS